MGIQKSTDSPSQGETYLGIELGSTRIKAVLVDKAHNQIASGSYNWENRLEKRILDIFAGQCLDGHPRLLCKAGCRRTKQIRDKA